MATQERTTRGQAALIVAVAVLASVAVPVVGVALAQGEGTPSIALLNPSEGNSTIISDKDIDGDGTYRLTAWVGNVPQDAIVEFELATTAGVALHTHTGVQVADDTWEFQWSIPGSVVDGFYVMRALLYADQEEVARDEVDVQVRHGEPLAATTAERAEFSFPGNGGSPGFYARPGGDQANTLIDLASTSDTTFIRARYTTSQPGTEPQWNVCGTESRSASMDGLRCRLAANVHPDSVTALSVVANTSPSFIGYQAAADAAGDAVRVLPYMQEPTAVTVAPARVTEVEACTDWIGVNVTDQEGRRIAEVNIDVHAVGPTDQLKFETDVPSGRPGNQAPDAGTHTTEPGWICPEPLPLIDEPSPQGEHNRAGLPDRKHIESTAGTNDQGYWEFRMYSEDQGDTQLAIWADVADNDLFCGNDPVGHTSLRWVEDPEAVDEGENPIHEPAPVEPQPTEAEECLAPPFGGGVSPSPSPTSTDPEDDEDEREFRDRRIGLRPKPLRNNGIARGRVRVVGGERPRCARRAPVRIQRRPLRGGSWSRIRSLRTNPKGAYRIKNPIRRGGEPRPGRYRAIAVRFTFVNGNDITVICRKAVSPVRRVPRR